MGAYAGLSISLFLGSIDVTASQFEAELSRQVSWRRADLTGFVPGIDSTNPTGRRADQDGQRRYVSASICQGVAIWYYRALLDKGALPALRGSVFSQPARLPVGLAIRARSSRPRHRQPRPGWSPRFGDHLN
jgi:hypothetical protein